MGYMLLAPELVIMWAARQFIVAKEIAVEHQGKGVQPTAIYQICDLLVKTAREWTKAHGFFVIMGGFALHDADKSFLRVLDERTLTELDNAGEIEWPTITEKEIQDRSKADVFSKGIVLVQTTWFIVSCVSRFATKLAVTELEVVTLAFAVLNGITYWLWWDKPSDVRCVVPVYLKSTEGSSNAKVSEARKQHPIQMATKRDGFLALFRCSFADRRNKHGLVLTILYTFLWVPIKGIFSHLWDMMVQHVIPDDDITRVPTFYGPKENKAFLRRSVSSWIMIGVITLFGAIHFIPWSFTFPTNAERSLWRVSAIFITGGLLLPLFLMIMSDWVSYPTLESTSAIMFGVFIPVYMISRTILLILPLILLRSLPPTAFLELKWSEFLPHI